MKKSTILLLPAFALLFCVSCDKASELTDVSFSTTLSQTLPVAVTGTSETTASILLDAAAADPEIQKYASNIKQYEITKLTFAIENYQSTLPDEIYFDGVFGFSKKTESAPTATCSISPLNVTHFAGTGDFNVGNCDAILTGISAIFTSDNAVKLYMTGTFTKAPLSFNLKVTAQVKVTASPL